LQFQIYKLLNYSLSSWNARYLNKIFYKQQISKTRDKFVFKKRKKLSLDNKRQLNTSEITCYNYYLVKLLSTQNNKNLDFEQEKFYKPTQKNLSKFNFYIFVDAFVDNSVTNNIAILSLNKLNNISQSSKKNKNKRICCSILLKKLDIASFFVLFENLVVAIQEKSNI